MKIAVLGGSFNPIHIGHLALADEVCSALGYDRVLFIPTYQPPHKEARDIVSAEDRLQMVRRACEGDGRFQAESCEIDRGGVSYTWDTVCFLEQKYAGQLEDRIGLIMGDDLLPGFHLWKNAEGLARKCRLILARRPMTIESASHANRPHGAYAQADFASNLDYDFADDPLFEGAVRLSNTVLPLSSTDIRTRAGEGGGFKYLVPAAVFQYIMERRLYTHGNN
ncbi:MAG: nicotinate (nicotinamide) nucleotide adenylyltransferase [Treponema sp.]|nr:nicotinate (nicotinamide) nucleotide adenylyltransferase [Treponema sp.]